MTSTNTGTPGEIKVSRAFAPASVSNVACGFDILGFAIDQLGDIVEARHAEEPGIRIDTITGDKGWLPTDPTRNTAGIAAQALLDRTGLQRTGLVLSIHKRMPMQSGLGSSAASSVAAAVAVDHLLGTDLPKADLVSCAVEGERFIGGTAHADNVAPSMVGGFVLVRGGSRPKILSLPVPEGLTCALVRPDLTVHTGEGRALLGDRINLRAAVEQWGNVGGLIAGLYRSDWDLIADCLVDVVAEPLRAATVKGFGEAKRAAIEAGALGSSLSGSGPAIFALCRGTQVATRVAQAMHDALREQGVTSEMQITPVGCPGARILGQDEVS